MKKTETTLRDPASIFACDWCLRDIITRLQKFLRSKLPSNDGSYYCLDKDGSDLDIRWYYTWKFCRKSGIGDDFVPLLTEYAGPACEGDFVNEFPVEEVISLVHQYKEEGQQ